METVRIEILNPKAKRILKGLADLHLISMKKEKRQSDFIDLINNLRKNATKAPSLEEITNEVEYVRSKRYEG